MTELVDEPLAALGLLHYALLVVLPDAAAEFIVVHGWTIFALTPEPGDAHRVLDLEDALVTVQPAYARAVYAWTLQQFLEELPEVDVRAAAANFPATCGAGGACGGGCGAGCWARGFVLVCNRGCGGWP